MPKNNLLKKKNFPSELDREAAQSSDEPTSEAYGHPLRSYLVRSVTSSKTLTHNPNDEI